MTITLPIGLVMRIAELLSDIAKMGPGFEIYGKAKKLSQDLGDELAGQLKTSG